MVRLNVPHPPLNRKRQTPTPGPERTFPGSCGDLRYKAIFRTVQKARRESAELLIVNRAKRTQAKKFNFFGLHPGLARECESI